MRTADPSRRFRRARRRAMRAVVVALAATAALASMEDAVAIGTGAKQIETPAQ